MTDLSQSPASWKITRTPSMQAIVNKIPENIKVTQITTETSGKSLYQNE